MRTQRLCLAVVLAITLVGSSWLFGQPPVRGGGRLPPNWTKLGLSDEQKAKVYSVQADYRTKIDALERQIKELRKKEEGELHKVLTAAQKARLKEIIAAKSGGGDADTKSKGGTEK